MTLEQEVIAAETRRYAAMVRADAVDLRDCISERLVYVHSSALVEDRAAFIDKLVSGQRKYLSFTPGGRKLTELGDTAVCVGDVKVEAMAGGKPVTTGIAFTAIYTREEGKLRMVGWHACTRPPA